MDADWLEEVLTATDAWFDSTLGPEISNDARELCPVFGGQNSTAKPESILAALGAGGGNRAINRVINHETGVETISETISGSGEYTPGALLESIEFHLDGHDLIVGATGSDERTYAYWVETGHRVVAWGHDMGYSKPPQPFLAPALYQVRVP